MQWLPALVDGKDLVDALFNVFNVATTCSKKQILRFLPEIFMTEYHPYLLPKLMYVLLYFYWVTNYTTQSFLNI